MTVLAQTVAESVARQWRRAHSSERHESVKNNVLRQGERDRCGNTALKT